jgi:RimJ/RimL family protein N-acetyltransferase
MNDYHLDLPVGPAAVLAETVAATVPVFETPRLTLRAPRLSDYPAYEVVFTSERAQYMGGPFTEDEAFADFCQGVAGWLLRGAGMWTFTLRGDDAPLGWIYLWQEKGDPEPEMGWVLVEAAEGQGFVTEAARAVMPHALALFGPGRFVSYIDAGNARSARIAQALGARRDAVAEAAMAARGETDLHVYRHTVPGEPS